MTVARMQSSLMAPYVASLAPVSRSYPLSFSIRSDTGSLVQKTASGYDRSYLQPVLYSDRSPGSSNPWALRSVHNLEGYHAQACRERLPCPTIW